eukprot:4843668-Pleurochrysis_carterae.AAC.1
MARSRDDGGRITMMPTHKVIAWTGMRTNVKSVTSAAALCIPPFRGRRRASCRRRRRRPRRRRWRQERRAAKS